MATSLTERIKNLLGSGIQPTTVAATVGCEPSYITQLMGDENFRNQVVELKSKALLASTLRDQEWDALEDALLGKMKSAVPMMMQPAMILKALQVVNGAKRRGAPPQEQTVINNTVVNLEFTQQKLVSFQRNSRGEIIEVEGRPLATLPSSIAANLAASMMEKLNDSTCQAEAATKT